MLQIKIKASSTISEFTNHSQSVASRGFPDRKFSSTRGFMFVNQRICGSHTFPEKVCHRISEFRLLLAEKVCPNMIIYRHNFLVLSNSDYQHRTQGRICGCLGAPSKTTHDENGESTFERHRLVSNERQERNAREGVRFPRRPRKFALRMMGSPFV